MSKSPLAGAFAEGSTPEKKKNKKGAALLIIAGIGLTASVGGVFAANSITINGGSAIQFGQGVADTNSCLSALTTEMTQAYDNTNGFLVDDVVLKPVSPETDFSDCNGKTLVVDLRTSTGVSRSNFTLGVVASSAGSGQILGTATSASVDRSSGSIAAGDIAKITVTTQ